MLTEVVGCKQHTDNLNLLRTQVILLKRHIDHLEWKPEYARSMLCFDIEDWVDPAIVTDMYDGQPYTVTSLETELMSLKHRRLLS